LTTDNQSHRAFCVSRLAVVLLVYFNSFKPIRVANKPVYLPVLSTILLQLQTPIKRMSL